MDVEAAGVFPMYFPGLQITHANDVSEALREALAAALLADAQQSFSAINSDALELGEVQLVQTDTARWAVSGEGALLQGKERPERIGFRFQAEFSMPRWPRWASHACSWAAWSRANVTCPTILP